MKINLMVQKREKEEFMSAKAKMLEQLQRDKEEKFGKKGSMTSSSAGDASSGKAKQMDPLD